jgi:hypothetical protein
VDEKTRAVHKQLIQTEDDINYTSINVLSLQRDIAQKTSDVDKLK